MLGIPCICSSTELRQYITVSPSYADLILFSWSGSATASSLRPFLPTPLTVLFPPVNSILGINRHLNLENLFMYSCPVSLHRGEAFGGQGPLFTHIASPISFDTESPLSKCLNPCLGTFASENTYRTFLPFDIFVCYKLHTQHTMTLLL